MLGTRILLKIRQSKAKLTSQFKRLVERSDRVSHARERNHVIYGWDFVFGDHQTGGRSSYTWSLREPVKKVRGNWKGRSSNENKINYNHNNEGNDLSLTVDWEPANAS